MSEGRDERSDDRILRGLERSDSNNNIIAAFLVRTAYQKLGRSVSSSRRFAPG